MFNNKRKIIINAVGVIFFIGILSFTYFRYSRYKVGPEIVSINIEKFMNVDKPSLSIKGELKNTQSIDINNRDIILQDKKTFHEILVFSPGTNIIDIGLKDAFGKVRSYSYNIFYKTETTKHPKTLGEAKDLVNQNEIEEELLQE